MESNKSAALASSLTGIICDVRIRRSAGEHRTRLTSANRQRRRHWPPDAMARRCREFVDSRLRRSPPDRASAVPYGQAGENAMRFPRLAHRSAAAHKLHSTPQQDRMNLISGKGETSSRLPAFSLFLPGSCPTYRDRRNVLIERGYKVVVQDYDFPLSSDLVEAMHETLKNARDLVVLFTHDYESSPYTRKEFTSFEANRLLSTEERRLIILRCEEVAPL